MNSYILIYQVAFASSHRRYLPLFKSAVCLELTRLNKYHFCRPCNTAPILFNHAIASIKPKTLKASIEYTIYRFCVKSMRTEAILNLDPNSKKGEVHANTWRWQIYTDNPPIYEAGQMPIYFFDF